MTNDAVKPTVTVIRDTPIDSYYLPYNRKWQAIATVECTGKRVWAAWMAGGVKEPDPNNYIVVAFSDDRGVSWRDPFLLIDCEGETRGRDPVLWRDPEGTLRLFYGFDKTYCLCIRNPEGDSLEIGEPFVIAQRGMILNKPVAFSPDEWICMFDPFDEERGYSYNCCFVSRDRGKSWTKRGEMPSASNGKLFWEGTVVRKRDGNLWALTRIERGENGGLEQSFSSDGGRNWTVAEHGLPEPFRGPGSKCCLRRLSSGNLAFVNNASPSLRCDLTFYLSKDDGKTWYSLLLDGRNGCAYPDLAEDDSGNVYVIWDYGRSRQNEIRISRFTERDVLQGCFGEGTLRMRAIAKNESWSDILSVEKFGKIVAVTEKGERIVLEGDVEKVNLTDPFGILKKEREES